MGNVVGSQNNGLGDWNPSTPTQSIAQKDMYFVDDKGILRFFPQGYTLEIDDSFIELTKEEFDNFYNVLNEKQIIKLAIDLYINQSINQSIPYKDTLFQADNNSLTRLMTALVANVIVIDWYDLNNEAISLNKEELQELISLISNRNSNLLNLKHTSISSLLECNTRTQLDEWLEINQELYSKLNIAEEDNNEQ